MQERRGNGLLVVSTLAALLVPFGLDPLGVVPAGAGPLGMASVSSQDICATPRLLTPTGTALPVAGFGLVLADARAEAQPAVTLVRGRRRTPLPVTPIGPGLFRATEVVRAGVYTLEGVTAASELTVSPRAPRLAPATAPSVRSARRVTSTEMGSGRTRTEILVELGFPVPPGVIVARAHWNGSSDVALWTSIAAGQQSLTLPTEPRCPVAGWQPPPEGPLTVTISLLDQLGQPSPLSEAVPVE